MTSKLEKVQQLSPIGSIKARRHVGSFGIHVYRGTLFRVSKSARIQVAKTLRLGYQWHQLPYYRGHLHLGDDAQLEVDGAFDVFSGCQISVNEGARLRLGSGYINNGARIACFREINIGDDCAISENVLIRDSDNHVIEDGKPVSAPIDIGDHVWVGIGATILKGVTIGDGAVVAAGAVVTRDVPPNSLVAGVPAVVKRTSVQWK